MNWFESRPLFGQTIVVTRTRQQASDLSDAAGRTRRRRDRSADDRARPAGRMVAKSTPSSRMSPNSTGSSSPAPTASNSPSSACWKPAPTPAPLPARSSPPSAMPPPPPSATSFAFSLDLCPKEFVAEALADEFAAAQQIARPRFPAPPRRHRPADPPPSTCEQAARPRFSTSPSTKPTRRRSARPSLLDALDAGEVNWITFTSSSTARNFVDLLGPDYRERLKTSVSPASGRSPPRTLNELGLEPAVQAEEF